MAKHNSLSRRQFLSRAVGAGIAAPFVINTPLFSSTPPTEKITIGCIGVGRMGMGDLRDIISFDDIRIVAVCDVDTWRLNNAKKYVDAHYGLQQKSGRSVGCAAYRNYRELLARKDIDAVMIVTPDHWHALPAIDAALEGKDIFLQKPLTLTIPEGRLLSDTVRRTGVILQVGSQQRSDRNFRFAAELVRNKYIGDLHTVKVGFGKDPFTGVHPVTPVPEELDYDFWLGPAQWEPYIEQRVHPPHSYGRPGWLRSEKFCCGMITGWGSHHMDSAHWGMGMEYNGPQHIEGRAEYSRDGTWDVHGAFRLQYHYPGGVNLICTDNAVNKQGVEFIGNEGTVYVRRGFIDAQPKSLLDITLKPDDLHLYHSTNHKRNWIDCIRSRQEPVAPVEIGHRSASACILGFIAMKLQTQLIWDFQTERFTNNDAANRLLWRQYRSPWRL